MQRIDRAALERPFPPEAIKTRRGPHGRELSYVEAPLYIERLNDAFNAEWTWQILKHELHGRELVVHGALTAGSQTKHAFGGTSMTVDRNGEVVSIADDLKAAATDALKKACSLFGIGLDLYASAPAAAGASDPQSARLQVVKTSDSDRQVREPDRGAPQDPVSERLTAKQLKYVYAIAHRDGISDARLRELSIEKFGVTPQFLSRRDASAFIDQLEDGAA